jgi:hypothetical protein
LAPSAWLSFFAILSPLPDKNGSSHGKCKGNAR